MRLWIGLAAIGAVGWVASVYLLPTFDYGYRSYGEVPVPGTSRLHLPAGDVYVSYEADTPGRKPAMNWRSQSNIAVPDVGLTVTGAAGVPQPEIVDRPGDGGGTSPTNFHRQVKVVRIAVDGDYTVAARGGSTTYYWLGDSLRFDHPRLTFGHDNVFRYVAWPFVALTAISGLAIWRARQRRR